MAKKGLRQEVLQQLQQVQGIGPKLAERVWERYGARTAQVLANDHAAVARAIRGISMARATRASQIFSKWAGEGGPQAVDSQVAGEPRSARRRRVLPLALPNADSTGGAGETIDMDEVRVRLRARWEQLQSRRRHVEEVFERHFAELVKLPGVCGAHVGLRRRHDDKGRARVAGNLEFCIRIHVKHKLPLGHPRLADPRLATLLPQQIEGVGVDVVERSYLSLEEQPTLDSFTTPEEPPGRLKIAVPRTGGYEPEIVGGIGIAEQSFPTNEGTLGAVMFAGFKVRFVTNQHVAGPVGSRVNQPANGNTPAGLSPLIGTVLDAEMPTPGRPTSIDCAILEPNAGGRIALGTLKNIGPPDRYVTGVLTTPDVHRTRAFKIGAVTGRTVGVVKSINTAVEVNGVMMPRQIIVESEDKSKIIAAGDSGSILITEADDHSTFIVVGLVHARSADSTALVATHFHEIENRFGIKPSMF